MSARIIHAVYEFGFYSQWVFPGKVDTKARYYEDLLSWQRVEESGMEDKVILITLKITTI